MGDLTKKEKTNLCREILYGNPEVTNEDFYFMMSVLAMHQEAEEKIGCGVARMWSAQNPVYLHTRNFFIERTDGSITDFSFTQCLSPSNHFKSACRNAIRPQIKAFREANNMGSDRHVDHHPESFDKLLARFVVLNGKGEVRVNKDMEFGCFLEEEDYKKKWCEFHQQEARLRDISDKENLTKKRI